MDPSDPLEGTVDDADTGSADDGVVLHLFGTPRLSRASTTTLLPGNRRSQLLGFLAVSGEWVPRGRLAMLLWPDAEAATARVNLRNLLLRLKRWLAGGGWPALRERADALRWRGATDVHAFWQAVAREDWSAALDSSQGELMAGLDAHGADTWLDWLSAERERIDRAWRRAALAQAQRLRGQPRACHVLAERMLARDPCDEEAATLHVQALATLHGQAAADAAAKRFVDRLRRELGAEPSWCWRLSAPARVEGGLRPPATHWIARPQVEAALQAWWDSDSGLAQLTGPPGAGKSALARWLAQAHEALWVTAAGAAEADTLDLRLAQAMGAVNAVVGRDRLVVVDEAEGVAGIEAWLARQPHSVPGLRLIVTTRHRLALPQALTVAVGSLAADEGSALFAACARQQDPNFDAGLQRAAIDAIVRRLDGSALAIELAAAWVRHWPAAAIAEALASPLELLGDEALRASIDRSWHALDGPLQAALAVLAWLPGPCSPELARLAAGVHLQQLRALLDHSLLRGTADGWLEMHALIRARVRERSPSVRDEVQRKQLATVAAWCRQAWPGLPSPMVFGPGAAQLDAAWARALQDRDAHRLESLMDALRARHGQHGALDAGLARLEQALGVFAEPAGSAVQAALRAARADLLTRAQRLAEAESEARAALRIARAMRRFDLARQAAHALGSTLLRAGDNARAWRCFAEAARLALACGDPGRAALALNGQGAALLGQNRLAESAAAHQAAIVQLRQIGARPGALVGPWVNLSLVHRAQGELAHALAAATEAVRLARLSGAHVDEAMAMGQLAACHVAAGDAVAALDVINRARALCDDPAQRYATAVFDVLEARAGVLLGDASAAARPLRARLSAAALAADAGAVSTSVLAAAAHWQARFGDLALADALARCVAAHPAYPAADRAALQAWRQALRLPTAARRAGAAQARHWAAADPTGLQRAAGAALAALGSN